MPFTLAAASGPRAASDLERLVHPLGPAKAVVRTHEEHAVAWAADSPWLSSRDDGEVLVVVDGRLHLPDPGDRSAADLLHERYLEVHDDFSRDLLGDFVVVVLDRRRRALLVCRDPVGVRPWYQATSGRRHAGATDIASLLPLPWISSEVDEESAIAHVAGWFESRGRSLYRAITTLLPGTTWRAGGGTTATWSHFAWNIEPEPDVPWDEAVNRCREALTEAVRCRVRALRSVASELSGGLDSSSVVGTVGLLGHIDQLAGRLLFHGPSADERRYSTAVMKHWGIEGVSAAPTILSMEESATLTALLRRPPPDPNFTMFTGLHQALAARGRTGILTGLGGDDAFIDTGLENRVISALQQRSTDVLGPMLLATMRFPRREWRGTIRPTIRSLLPRARRRPPAYIPRWVADAHGLSARYAELPQRLTGVRSIDVRAAGLTSGHVASVLQGAAVVDDLTGIRRSHPFLDPRLVTTTYGLNPWFPVRNGHYRALEAVAYADRLPRSVAERRTKAEFSEVVWPVSLRADVMQRIMTGPLAARGWLSAAGVENVLRDAHAARAHAALPLCRMTNLDGWLRLIGG